MSELLALLLLLLMEVVVVPDGIMPVLLPKLVRPPAKE